MTTTYDRRAARPPRPGKLPDGSVLQTLRLRPEHRDAFRAAAAGRHTSASALLRTIIDADAFPAGLPEVEGDSCVNVSFRVSPAQRDRFRAVAEARGAGRSGLLRQLIDNLPAVLAYLDAVGAGDDL